MLFVAAEERASVAAELVASLDGAEGENPANVKAAWAAENEARSSLLAERPGTPWKDVRRRVEAELRRR